ncbi:acetate--CoA ligase [Pollutimonas nitritireducens]|uniref:Acetyl-coenzyme A synthetase n=1 Tax=Pollutimonas nitritireducens TaxID=2045209 RepID=A0A2N4UFK3_9BURK|nr:acetate--CoA ligase [Pollutimonas nitritireducens]PLC53807.1 acetate--CoA ligase [Pollutimonas nitritireducens]
MSSGIESVLTETRVFPPFPNLVEGAAISGMKEYQALCDEARQSPDDFWGRLARENLNWTKPFSQVLDESEAPFYRWFADGEMNVSANCLDKHLATPTANKTALIFEADDGKVTSVTYKELHARVCKFANGLKSLGHQAGERAIIYLPMSIEAVVAMQACARLGIIHSVVFGGFSSKSLHERTVDVGATLVITADEQVRGGKSIPLKNAVDEALSMGGCEAVSHVVVYKRTGGPVQWNEGRDIWMNALSEGQSDQCEPVSLNAEHPLFILYTSGSTGKPKGVQHATAGFLLWALLTVKWTFDAKDSDVFWCTADVGWVTGHTYITYGPLAAGLTQVVFEGIPTYPNVGRFWEMIQRHKVTVFYTAPTAIRSLSKAAEGSPDYHPREYDLSSLRIIGSVGEPINPEAWMWYYTNVGRERCPVLDTWWQTETGAHMITPLPGVTPLKPGSCTLPLPGIAAAVVDEAGEPLESGKGGFLVVQRPWPGMIRTIWGDPERFKKSYFPSELKGAYLAGDGAQCDADGYFWIMGRIDDVLNVSGHRLGTMEVESALVSHSLVAEAAVVGRPDATTGEAVVAFVVLNGPLPEGAEAAKVAKQLRDWVAKEIGPIAKPKDIRFGENLPKTRSGKIMRRLLRVVAQGESVTQDVSTLENPAILDQLSQAW